jgi:hypothetical protein
MVNLDTIIVRREGRKQEFAFGRREGMKPGAGGKFRGRGASGRNGKEKNEKYPSHSEPQLQY